MQDFQKTLAKCRQVTPSTIQKEKFFYKAAMDRTEMASEAIREISTQFFNNSPVEMIHFIEREFDLVK